MADEITRVLKFKKVKLPTDGTVKCPLIAQIAFVDPLSRGQEIQFSLFNTIDGDRETHIALVKNYGSDETGGDNTKPDAAKMMVKVERVDILRVADAPDRAQETFLAPDSRTVAQPPDAPPFFTTHEKTHVVRYINDPDDGNSLDSELIDQFNFLDGVDRGQETFYFLQNPPDHQIDGLTISSTTDPDGSHVTLISIDQDAEIEDITDPGDGDNGIDPPWRFDPFQNPIGWNAGFWIGAMGQAGALLHYSYTVSYPPCPQGPDVGACTPVPPQTITNEDDVQAYKIQLYRSTNGDDWELIDLTDKMDMLFSFSVPFLDFQNGVGIITAYKTEYITPTAALSCFCVGGVGGSIQIYISPVSVSGTQLVSYPVALKSFDFGKTWEQITTTSHDFSQVVCFWEDDNNRWKVTFQGNQTETYYVDSPFDPHQFAGAVQGDNEGNIPVNFSDGSPRRTMVRTANGDGYNALETTHDFGDTWVEKLRVIPTGDPSYLNSWNLIWCGL